MDASGPPSPAGIAATVTTHAYLHRLQRPLHRVLVSHSRRSLCCARGRPPLYCLPGDVHLGVFERLEENRLEILQLVVFLGELVHGLSVGSPLGLCAPALVLEFFDAGSLGERCRGTQEERGIRERSENNRVLLEMVVPL